MTLGRCLSHDNVYLTPSKGRSDSPLRLPCYLLSINFTRRRNKRKRWRQTEEFTFKKMTSRRKSLQDVIDFIYRTFLKNKNKIMIQWKFRDFTTLFSCKKLTLHTIGIQCSKKEVKKQTVKWMRRKKGQHARQGCISLIRVRIYRVGIRGILTNRESVPFHNLKWTYKILSF